jgi:hypothetical protein
MAVNFHISKDGNLVTIRHLKDSFNLQTPNADRFLNVPRYQEDFNTQSYHLTASNPSDNNVKIVGPDGRVIINAVPYTALKTGTSNSAIGASVAATVTALNGTSFFAGSSVDEDISANSAAHTSNLSNITSLQNTVTSEQAKTLALENAVKTATGDRGVYVTNSKDETSSKVKLTTTTAKLQAGAKTGIEADETSPGSLTFTVAAGASGSEVETTALTISGTTQGKTAVDFITSGFTIKSNSSSAGGTVSLLEASANGTHKLNLRAPAALTAETTLIFPDGAGSNGQVLSTDGAGVLSWVNQSGGLSAIHGGASDILRLQSNQIGVSTNLTSTIAADRLLFYDHSATKLTALELGSNLTISGTTLNASGGSTSYVLASHSGRASMYYANRYYYGSSAYGWATDSSISYSQTSATSLNDQYAHMGIVAPTAITNLALKATVRNDSSSDDVELYVFRGSRPNGSENSISLTQLFYVSSGTDSDQDLHFSADASTSSAGISAGDLVFLALKRGGASGTKYVNISYTLFVS